MPRNVHAALRDGLAGIFDEGQVIVVRGSEVTELRPYMTRLDRPEERVYVIKHRNNNIFAAIAETVWVLAGRNDLEFLSRYLLRAADFSDDGVTWRGGYGPRLRNWRGVDQLKQIAQLLQEDIHTRRAVMVIFDPSLDYVNSKDIPCNNWLHFIVRNNKLHLHVVLRSNDVLWGFSGINTFEWSVLHEMMAKWTGVDVGEMIFFVSSFHLYARHYERAQKMLQEYKDKSLYDFGFRNMNFDTAIDGFDDMLQGWFDVELKMRQNPNNIEEAINQVSDPFFRTCLDMLHVYNLHLSGADKSTIANKVQSLPSSDFKVAAIEYFVRVYNDRDFIILSQEERDYFDYYWSSQIAQVNNVYPLSFRDIVSLLAKLHYKKTLVYKDSWKKHGEVLGVFANISRKYDRIESILLGNSKDGLNESLVDTIADIGVYAAKYLTYLAETYPDMFSSFVQPYDTVHVVSDFARTIEGFELILDILDQMYNESGEWNVVSDYAACFQRISNNYKGLEAILIGHDSRAANPLKCVLAADLALVSFHQLALMSRIDGEKFARFVQYVNEF
jgi:thymidylate synthase